MAIPRTKREKYMQERADLYAALENAQTAYNGLASGRITSYTLGNRTVSRNAPDLKALTDFIQWAEGRIDELEAVLNGRSRRNVTKNVYLMPSFAPFWVSRG